MERPLPWASWVSPDLLEVARYFGLSAELWETSSTTYLVVQLVGWFRDPWWDSYWASLWDPWWDRFGGSLGSFLIEILGGTWAVRRIFKDFLRSRWFLRDPRGSFEILDNSQGSYGILMDFKRFLKDFFNIADSLGSCGILTDDWGFWLVQLGFLDPVSTPLGSFKDLLIFFSRQFLKDRWRFSIRFWLIILIFVCLC